MDSFLINRRLTDGFLKCTFYGLSRWLTASSPLHSYNLRLLTGFGLLDIFYINGCLVKVLSDVDLYVLTNLATAHCKMSLCANRSNHDSSVVFIPYGNYMWWGTKTIVVIHKITYWWI